MIKKKCFRFVQPARNFDTFHFSAKTKVKKVPKLRAGGGVIIVNVQKEGCFRWGVFPIIPINM